MSDLIATLLAAPVVVAIGASHFADSVREQGAEVVLIEWRPPRTLSDVVRRDLEKLLWRPVRLPPLPSCAGS